jgi:uncharacterized membrane protein YbhN (UPF0104 family)
VFLVALAGVPASGATAATLLFGLSAFGFELAVGGLASLTVLGMRR